MIKTISTFYNLIKWLILLLLVLLSFLVFVLESPATLLNLLKKPLKEQGISYGKMEGGLLSGFTLENVNYNNQVKAKEVALQVDFEALKNRVLVIDNLVLKEAQIDKTFLTSLIDTNSSDTNKSEGNLTLPFDRILVKNADISIENTGYENYYINSAKLHIENLETDMQKEHKGTFTFLLDSNMSQADIKASFKNETYDVVAKVEGNRDFIAPFIEEHNLTLLVNPKLTLKAKGDLNAVKYEANIQALSLKQNDYLVKSKLFRTKGTFNIEENSVVNTLNTKLDSNVAYFKLDAITSLDLDDINSTLIFDIDGTLKPKKTFIPALLAEQNITIQALPHITLLAKGEMNRVEFKTTINGLKAKQNGLALNLKDLKLKGSAKPLKGDVNVDLLTHFNSSIADGDIKAKSSLNYKDLNNTLIFDVKSNLLTHGAFLNPLLKEANITVNGDSKLSLIAKGDMKHVQFSTKLQDFRAKQNDINIDIKDVNINGAVKPLQGDTNVKLSTHFNSSVADGDIKAKSSLNYKDLNNTLIFDVKSNLLMHGVFLNPLLKEANVTVNGDSKLSLIAKGDMKHVQFSTKLQDFRAKQNDINIEIQDVSIDGAVKPLQGDTNVKLSTHFNSSVADGELLADAKLNFNDVNNSLKFTSKLDSLVHDGYVNKFLKDANVTLRGDSRIKLDASGNMRSIRAKVDVKAKVFAQDMLSDLTLKTSDINVDLEQHKVEGNLKFNSKAKQMRLNVKSNFSGDYTQPKKMITQTEVEVRNFNAFGVNLNSLTPLNLNINNSLSGAIIKLDSKKIQLNAKSVDFDHITFELKTDRIYPAKIVEVPEELKEKFVKLNLAGDATISKQYLTLKGFIESNKKFRANINAKNSQNGLDANLYTKHLKINAKGNVTQKNIKAIVEIDSLTKVQEEFVTLYPFTVTPINGGLKLKAELKGEEILANISSSKLKFDGFNVENIDIDAHYNEELVTLNRVNFETTGFQDEKLNKKFYLNKKGLIYLGEKRDVSLDLHPNILVDMKGTSSNLKGVFSIESLPLGHPDYGTVFLSTAINYEQVGKKKKIIGGISLEKMKLFYEAKFLDPANDADVVIITKKDKNKNKKENNSFLEDTFIDLAIYAPDARYKTRDIELDFTVDVTAKKVFGKNLGMLGKVREIYGRVEQAPKLFKVVDSSIVFRGTKEINPLLDIEVQHELPDVLITIFIHGDAKHPKLDFSSDPQMAKKDILSYLLLGVSTTALSEGSGNLGREAQLFIMNQAARDLAYEVELDRVFIKDDGTGEGYAVQVGKKINEETMFVIENSKEGNSFILEYEVSKNIKVEVGQHQKTIPSQSIDIFFRKKFK